MKATGTIKDIGEIEHEVTGVISYAITIVFEDMPNLKLGKCEVVQNDKS